VKTFVHVMLWLQLFSSGLVLIAVPYVLYKMIFKVQKPQKFMCLIIAAIWVANVGNFSYIVVFEYSGYYDYFLALMGVSTWLAIIWTLSF